MRLLYENSFAEIRSSKNGLYHYTVPLAASVPFRQANALQ